MRRFAFLLTFPFLAIGCTPDLQNVLGHYDVGPPCQDGGGCPCAEIGAKSCDPTNPLIELQCVPAESLDGGIGDADIINADDSLDAGDDAEAGTNATGIIHIGSCPAKSSCIEGMGCQPCVDKCSANEPFTCSDDMKSVVSCKPTGPAQCLDKVVEIDCAANNLSVCKPPDMTPPDAGPVDYCVNECGGRGVVLEHPVCSPHPELPCAFWVCDAETHGVKPDHVSCLAGGADCSKHEECASCACINGLCMGSAKKSCVAGCP